MGIVVGALGKMTV